MNKIKVMQVNKLYYPVTGGIEKVVQEISEGLNDKVDMRVLVCNTKNRTSQDVINGVTVYRASSLGVLFSMPISFSFIYHFRKLAKNRDVIQLHMPFPLADIAYLLSGYKGKLVVWWHSDIVRQKKLMKIYEPFMHKVLKKASTIIVATDGHIKGSDYLKQYEGKCIIVPYGMRYEHTQVMLNDATLRRDKNLVKFLFVGRLVYYKGCKVLLESFSGINSAELTIIGTGCMEKELKEFCKKLGISNRVKFLGEVSDSILSKEYNNCDVFVLPSIEKSEAFGLVQTEAMFYGKPVINTNLQSGVPYVSIDKVTGLTVPPNDVDKLRKAMIWMKEHEKERIEMGLRGKQRVEKYFSLDNMCKLLLQEYCNE